MPSFADKLDDLLVRNIAYFNYKSYVKRLVLKGNEKVLEVGCGGGNLSRFLAERTPNGKLVCIDSSKYWIDKAKRRLRYFDNIKLRLEDILNLKEENFDVAVVYYVLHDIQKQERGKAINILRKSLKENARVYIREPMRKAHGMAPEEIENLMLNRGFLEIKSKQGYSFPLRGKVYEGVFQKNN